MSLGVQSKVYYRLVLRIHRQKGVPPLNGVRIGIRISWQSGVATGSARFACNGRHCG
jgi:hypothetical protein